MARGAGGSDWPGWGLGVSPDGRTIVFARVDNPSSDLMMIENFR